MVFVIAAMPSLVRMRGRYWRIGGHDPCLNLHGGRVVTGRETWSWRDKPRSLLVRRGDLRSPAFFVKKRKCKLLLPNFLGRCGGFVELLGVCGSAALAAAFPVVGTGLQTVPLALGLAAPPMAFAIGYISGCHLNPMLST